VFLLVANIYFFSKNKEKNNEIETVKSENVKLKEDNKSYKEKQELYSLSAREKYYKDLTKQARLFVQLAYVENQDIYQKQRELASNVMDKKLKERFFPSANYKTDVDAKVTNDKYYIQELKPGETEIEVIVKADHEINFLKTGNKDKETIYARVTFENRDGHWMATKLGDIFDQLENEDYEEDETDGQE